MIAWIIVIDGELCYTLDSIPDDAAIVSGASTENELYDITEYRKER